MQGDRDRLAAAAFGANVPTMKRAISVDLGHLTPAERMELIEQLWDSLSDAEAALIDELRRRRAMPTVDTNGGEP